jgi:hypothetical protein
MIADRVRGENEGRKEGRREGRGGLSEERSSLRLMEGLVASPTN